MARLFDDASSQYLVRTNAVVAGVPLTMACWFYCDDANNVGTLLSLNNGTSSSDWHRMVLVGTVSPKQLRANSGTGPFGEFQANAIVTGWSANTWHHAAGVFAAHNSRQIYLDGASGTDSTSVSPGTLSRTHCGSYETAVAGRVQYFSGRMAEVAFWNVALTAAEIAILAKGFSPRRIRPQNLVAYWPLFGRVAPEIDLVGGNSLTLGNSPTAADHPPIIYPVESRRRRALSRDPSPKTRRGHAVTIDTSIGEMGSIFAERNVLHADESSAGVSIFPDISGQSSHWLCVLMYSRLPSDATPVGMQVTVKHRYVDSSDHMVSMSSVKAKAIKGGSLVGDELTLDGVPSLADDWEESSAGGATELWGTTWDADDWNATDSDGKPTSGVALRWITSNSSPDQFGAIDVEHVRITRWYSDSSGQIVEVPTAHIAISAIAPTTAKSAALPAAGLRVNAFAPSTNKIAPLPTGNVKVSGVAPAIAKIAPLPAGNVKVSGVTPATEKIAPLPTTGVGVNGITPATTKVASVPAAGVGVSARVPATAKQTAVPTATVEITSHAPTTLKAADVPTAGISIAAQPLDGGTVANVPTAGIAVAGIAPSTAKLAPLPTAGIEVAAREPATAKAAAVPTATVQVEGLAPTAVFVAAVPTAGIAIQGVEPGTAKAAAVMPGQVVVLAMPMVEPIIVTARATAYLPVHGADPRIITVYGVDIRPLDVTGTSPVPREVKG